MPLTQVQDFSPYLGCDPEFFFKNDGGIIGAEKIIPKDGLLNTVTTNLGTYLPDSPTSKFIIDGVQAELNPRPNTCRANLANEIAACFKTLATSLKDKGVSVDFSQAVEISKENLMELDEQSRKFGCTPSKSIYKKAGVKIKDVDPTEYRIRAAGGHIHIGKGGLYGAPNIGLQRALTEDHRRTVHMLDILCGNTAVLMDRNESNIERRKLYGRAGEFRLPAHGLEYRTLSNFWLTAYPLMSFAFGMTRLAVQLMSSPNYETYYAAFTDKVKTKNVHAAINNNDFDLAMENFKAIEELIMEVTPSGSSRYPIHRANLKQFYHFIDKVKTEGLVYWFKQDPMEHWTNLPECHGGGFHDYLAGHVNTDMIKKAA